jgi:hypothetical protein
MQNLGTHIDARTVTRYTMRNTAVIHSRTGKGREDVPHRVARVFGGEGILDAARQCTRVHEIVLPDHTQTHEANQQMSHIPSGV